MTKLERIAASRGQTLHDMMRELSASGKTLLEVQAETGVTYQAILTAMKKRGIVWHDRRAYAHRGHTDTTAGHCARWGYDYRRVEQHAANYGMTYRASMMAIANDASA
jgi:hypothetical protein